MIQCDNIRMDIHVHNLRLTSILDRDIENIRELRWLGRNSDVGNREHNRHYKGDIL